MAEGIGAGFDRRRIGGFHLDGPQAHAGCIDAVIRGACAGNVDFLDGAELAASGFRCGLGSALTVVDSFFDQVFFDLVGVFIGETYVVDLVGTETAGLVDDLRYHGQVGQFDFQVVAYRIRRDFLAFHVVVRRHIESRSLHVFGRDAHGFQGIGHFIHGQVVLGPGLLGVGIGAGRTDGDIGRIRCDFLLGIARDGDDRWFRASCQGLRGSEYQGRRQHGCDDQAFQGFIFHR